MIAHAFGSVSRIKYSRTDPGPSRRHPVLASIFTRADAPLFQNQCQKAFAGKNEKLARLEIGGTSAGAPQWSALIAIVNSMRLAANKRQLTGANELLYAVLKSSYTANYNDIAAGSNGACGAECSASPGYDFVTGLGSPKAVSLVNTLLQAQ